MKSRNPCSAEFTSLETFGQIFLNGFLITLGPQTQSGRWFSNIEVAKHSKEADIPQMKDQSIRRDKVSWPRSIA
jgi:hypothetical protein